MNLYFIEASNSLTDQFYQRVNKYNPGNSYRRGNSPCSEKKNADPKISELCDTFTEWPPFDNREKLSPINSYLTAHLTAFLIPRLNLIELLRQQNISLMKVNLSSLFEQLKSSAKLFCELEVWPPSLENSSIELTLTYNIFVLEIMLTSRSTLHSSVNVESFILKALQRALRLMEKENLQQCSIHLDLEATVLKILDHIKDPLIQFKVLKQIPFVLVLWSIWCIYRRQQGNEKQLREAVRILVQLKNAVNPLILMEPVPLKHDLMGCISRDETTNHQALYPTVSDIVRLVLTGCRVPQGETDRYYIQWEWLHAITSCEDLLKQKNCLACATRLEKVLKNFLEPEQKSRVLSLLAQCYFLQGFPQLAIRMYQEALKTNNANLSVLLHLAKVYESLKLASAELEILTLLIKMLKEKNKLPEKTAMTGLDAIVDEVCQVNPEVNLPTACYAAAACCRRQKSYQEATEHYLALLQVLDTLDTYMFNTNRSSMDLEMSKILTETAETLYLATQYSECISFCDKFIPCWISSSSAHCSFMNLLSPKFDESWDVGESSQQSLFSDSMGFGSSPLVGCSELEECDLMRGERNVRGGSDVCVHNVCQVIRKRLRSSSVSGRPEANERELELWQCHNVAVKLLLCKSDALYKISGASEDTLNCLTQAYNLLVSSNVNIFTAPASKLGSPTRQPSPKRRRLELGICSKEQTEDFNFDIAAHPIKEWAELTITTSLRMAQVFWQRREFLSVQNCCSLVLQLEPDNINAQYLQLTVLQDQNLLKVDICKKWLLKRNITYHSEIEVSTNFEKNQTKMQQRDILPEDQHWWSASQSQLLMLDKTCLNEIKKCF